MPTMPAETIQERLARLEAKAEQLADNLRAIVERMANAERIDDAEARAILDKLAEKAGD